MRRIAIVLAIASAICLIGCRRAPPPPPPKTVFDVGDQLTEQFRKQHDAHKDWASRKIEAVQVTSFGFPGGNPHPYLGIGITWNGVTTYTSVPMVQLGDGLFGVTYQDAITKEELSAIISFR